MNIESIFQDTPAQRYQLAPKRNGLYQIIAPLFHEDGDMMSIFISEKDDGKIILSDEGISLMRLSYTFDLDTDNKIKLFNRTLSARDAYCDNGSIIMETDRNRIYPAIMEFSQLINTVCNFDSLLSRETVSNLFYDNLRKTIEGFQLPDSYKYRADAYMAGYRDMKIDYLFESSNKPPLCLFGVKDTNKAQQVTICCLTMLRLNIPFKSCVVFEALDSPGITKFARNSLVNTAGKVFSDVNGFEENGLQFFRNELSA